MALTKEQLAEAREFLSSLEDVPKGPTAEAKAAIAKQKEIRAATHKTRKYAYYMVGPEGAFVGGKRYSSGEVVQLPVEKLPSKTWKPTTAEGVAVAEAELKKKLAKAAELAGAAKDDEALDADEVDVGGDEPEADEVDADVDEEPEEKPAAKKPAAKAGKAGKAKRPSDKDVA